ncbi:hypothetical protein MTR72_24820 [Bradyrhizobium sp. ISRA442]|uniref:hypothetical protein n=1 Tax=Bradyrhizobium sp. ISRA442 TaxID=2866197 RepID=UPI00311AF215
MSEQDCEADFTKAVEIVMTLADSDKVIGHAANGRGEGHSSAYAEAKAQAELHRARRLELMNLKAEGKLVDRAEATEIGVRIFAEIRTAFLALGRRVADKAAGQTAREVTRIIDSEVRDVLTTLADEARFIRALDDEALS